MMNPKRTATIVVVGGALLAWLAGAATSNRADRAGARDRYSHDRQQRCRAREGNRAPPRTPAADRHTCSVESQSLLVPLGSGPRGSGAEASPAAPALVEAPPLPPPLPPLKLVGVAEDPGADGPARTAIVVGDGQLYTVKEGENVTARYRVTRISADVVELLDLNDNAARSTRHG